MWEIFVSFIITWISLWLISKILGKGLVATAGGLFWAAIANAFFGAIFRYAAFLLFLSPIKLPQWIIVSILFSITLLILPAFTFWFADKFIKGFKVRSRKYFSTACLWFVFIGIVGVGIANMFPFLGLGFFGLGSRWVGGYAHPGWFYSNQDSFYFYSSEPSGSFYYD
jgi:hypothetical protein